MKKIGIFLSLILSFTLAIHADTAEKNVVDSMSIAAEQAFSEEPTYTKALADSAYIKEEYATAVEIYENLLQKGVSAEIYYNLGNAYYKLDNIAKAILNYERAVLLSPNNGDYKANLAIASNKKVDKDELTSELFFVSWGKSIVNWMTSDQWAATAITLFIIFLICLMSFFLSKNTLIKKVGFIIAIIALVGVPITNYCSLYQKKKITNQDTAIVMEPSVTVRSTPSETGTSLFVIHEGKKVRIKDNAMTTWKEIELENGEVGWLPTESIEVI